jgi:hypothetical protein
MMQFQQPSVIVMPGFMPGIYAFLKASFEKRGVNGRDRPGHDESNDDFAARGLYINPPGPVRVFGVGAIA